MLLYNKDEVLQVDKIQVTESFMAFTTSIEVEAPFPVFGTVELAIGDQKFKITPLTSIKLSDYSFKTLLVPNNYYKALLRTNEPITGTYTLEQVLNLLNLTWILNKETQSSYWEIPSMTLKELMLYLQKRASVAGGGGFVSTFNLAGAYLGIDLKTAFSKQPAKELPSNIISQTYDQTWIGEIPGIVRFRQDLLDEYREVTLTFEEGFMESFIYQLLPNPNFVGLKETMMRNAFYQAYYTSNRVKTSDQIATLLTIGALVTLRGHNYVIYSVEYYQNGSANMILVSA